MWKNSVSRPTNRRHIFTIDAAGDVVAQVKGRTGRTVRCEITTSGRVSIPSECYHATLRLADGGTKVVRLLSDKAASATLLARMQLEEDQINSGQRARSGTTDETLSELVSRYHKEREVAGISHRQQVACRRFLTTAFEGLALRTLGDVRALGAGKVSTWVLGLDAAPHTKRHIASGLRSFLRWLHDQKLVPEVPRFPRIQGEVVNQRRTLSREEVDRLANAAPWPRSLLYALAYATIARRGALLALTAADVHFGKAGPWLVLRPEKSKTGQGQAVPVPPRLVKNLRRLVRENPTGPLFPGVRVQLDGNYAWEKDLAAAGIPKVTPEGAALFHGLRHSGTTALVRAGVSLEVVRKMGGWQSLEMLARHYSHLEPLEVRELVDKVFE